MTSSNCSMSSHDKEVLSQIFSQGLPYDEEEENNYSAGENGNVNDVNHNEIAENNSLIQAKALEGQAVLASENNDFTTSLELLNQAVALVPHKASIYNNRAQVLRLKGDIAGALEDLDKALELSNERGSVACQAFTQRGLIRIRNDEKDAAKEDLGKAASLGSSFAKQVLAAMNPYAALCNQMLGEVFQKLRNTEAES